MNFEFLWIDDDRLREFLMTSPDDLLTFPSDAVPDMGWRRTESLREYHARMTKPQLVQITNYEPDQTALVGDNNQWPNDIYAFFVYSEGDHEIDHQWCTVCIPIKDNIGSTVTGNHSSRMMTVNSNGHLITDPESDVWMSLYRSEYIHVPCPPSKAWEIMLDQISQYREQRATRFPDRATE